MRSMPDINVFDDEGSSTDAATGRSQLIETAAYSAVGVVLQLGLGGSGILGDVVSALPLSI